MRRIDRLTAGLVVALVLSGSACGGDDEPAAPEAANGNAPSGARNVDRFLMRNGEQPGFRPDGDASTVVGVNAIAKYWKLSPAAAQQLRDRGFISFTTRRTLGREAGGVSEVLLFGTPEGARNQMAYDLRASTIHATLPETKIPASGCATSRARAAGPGATCTATPSAPCSGCRVAACSCSSARASSPSSRCSRPVRGRSTSEPGATARNRGAEDDSAVEPGQRAGHSARDRAGLTVPGGHDAGGPVQGIRTLPEIIWELSLAIYPLIWGFKSSAILAEEGRPALHPAVLAR